MAIFAIDYTMFKTFSSTEKAPGMFATIVIILPSQYTRGQCWHGIQTKSKDMEAHAIIAISQLLHTIHLLHSSRSTNHANEYENDPCGDEPDVEPKCRSIANQEIWHSESITHSLEGA
ncbi:hypothetical protein BDN71DRAFT_1430407 [Pleurotus eryngii]|uniref:Uncharacterized protein n=1 Tax=Pleurotus eryngii TaxID=5323 RepID=A0A9P5ZXJ0_PLEER|nr:hypothetical protein BDN71DRAFT_1430407 [Pleurotus eryngii]